MPTFFFLVFKILRQLSTKFVLGKKSMPLNANQLANVPTPGYASGRYYTNDLMHNMVTQNVGANNLYYFPINISVRVQLATIAARVNSAVTGTCRLGVYDNLNGNPNKFLFDAGTIDCGTTGNKEIALTNTFLSANWYWFTLFAGCNATFDSSNGMMMNGIIGNSVLSTSQVTGIRATLTYGSMPSTAVLTSILLRQVFR